MIRTGNASASAGCRTGERPCGGRLALRDPWADHPRGSEAGPLQTVPVGPKDTVENTRRADAFATAGGRVHEGTTGTQLPGPPALVSAWGCRTAPRRADVAHLQVLVLLGGREDPVAVQERADPVPGARASSRRGGVSDAPRGPGIPGAPSPSPARDLVAPPERTPGHTHRWLIVSAPTRTSAPHQARPLSPHFTRLKWGVVPRRAGDIAWPARRLRHPCRALPGTNRPEAYASRSPSADRP